jgi:hypothetical protein
MLTLPVAGVLCVSRADSGFWAVATSVLGVFSISPTAAYGHYAKRGRPPSLMVTIIYAVYAIGIVASPAWASAVGEGSAALRAEHQHL